MMVLASRQASLQCAENIATSPIRSLNLDSEVIEHQPLFDAKES